MSNIVKYKTHDGREVGLSFGIIRQTIAKNELVTDDECVMFLALCKAHGLDPFLKEAYLIKYGNQPATICVGKDVYLKRAQANPDFDGFEAGLFVITAQGKYKEREGSMVLPGEKVVGAWAKVYVKSKRVPFYDSVSFEEYKGTKKDGSTNSQWTKMPGTMIRKVALVHALRDAFPDELSQLYDAAEMGVDLPTEPAGEPIQTEAVVEQSVPVDCYEGIYEEDEF